eukprot:PhM_4_TR9561/c3_g1_i1/m.38082
MHVLRLSTPIEWNGERHDTFALTRVAMGSSFSAHVAQTVTWALLEEVLGMPEVVVATMIDNVAIAIATTRTSLLPPAFVVRCDHVGATLNDRNDFPSTAREIAMRGALQAQNHTFLGETYTKVNGVGHVMNSEKNVSKLRRSSAASMGRDHPRISQPAASSARCCGSSLCK